MNLTIHAWHLTLVLSLVLFVIPFFIKPQPGLFGGFNVYLWSVGCWPPALVFLIWTLVDGLAGK